MSGNGKKAWLLGAWVCLALAAGDGRAQGQNATVDAVSTLLRAAVSNPNHAGYAGCQLRAAIWGNYGIRVFMPAASTVGNRALIFQIARGILYQLNDPTSNPNVFPTVSRDGRVYLPDRAAAFAKGVPFWIGDVSFTPSASGSVRIGYTVYSNPSVTLGFEVTIFDVFESTEVSGMLTTINRVIYNRFASGSEPQTFTGALAGFAAPALARDDHLYAATGSNSLVCPLSNEVDLWAASVDAPTIRRRQPVLQAFNDAPILSSGTWIQIFGEKLSATTRSWSSSDFQGTQAPTSLDGVRVNVNGKPAFVAYISPNQVNVQVPDDEVTGNVTVEVINAKGTSNTVTVPKFARSIAYLTTPDFTVNGKQYLAALFPDFTTFVGPENLIAGVPFRPARPGEVIIAFAVGCGPSIPPTPAGQVLAEARPLETPFPIFFGTVEARVQRFLAADAVGLCQFNITVPDVPAGDVPINPPPNFVSGAVLPGLLYTTVGR